MKKCKSFRMLCILLTLLLMGQLAVNAFAAETGFVTATDSYTDSFGVNWTFEVRRSAGEVSLKDQPIVSTKKYHAFGMETVFFAGTYTISHTPTIANAGYSEILDLASKLSIPMSFSLDAYTNGVQMEIYEDSGYYCLDTDFYGYNGYWDVISDEFGYESSVDGGYFEMAAYGCMGITGYVRFS